MEVLITRRDTKETIFTANIEDKYTMWPYSVQLVLAVVKALQQNADLSNADLSNADLSNAYLIDGGQRRDGYRFVGWLKEGQIMIRAGCRNFTLEDANNHLGSAEYRDALLGKESLLIVQRIKDTAIIRGLIKE